MASGIHGPEGTVIATTTSRIVAYVADTFVVGIASWAAWFAVDQVLGTGPSTRSVSDEARGTVIVAGAAIDSAYFIVLWSGGRRTLGMRLLRLRVVRMADAGPVPIASAALRWAVVFLPDVLLNVIDIPHQGLPGGTLLFLVSGWVWTLVLLASVVVSPRRQGIHDRVAGTAVVVSEH